MKEGRAALSRILAINWYGFRQIIDLDGATVIAGGFGTGKSALLDLVQYIMLGGQQWRPNRSAAGHRKSRDLVSYCLCDTNTERDGKTHYTRPSAVTIGALEFSWPGPDETRRRETWGIRAEYSSPTAEARLSWFHVPCRLEWSDLAPDGKNMLEEDAFRTAVRRDWDGQVFQRAVDYLDEMAAPKHLHFDRVQMNKTMPKAIAFEPEENFEKFIREFLLEPSPVDVREVRQSLNAHRDMQDRLARLHEEAGFLRRIEESHVQLLAAEREADLFHHAKAVLEHAEAAERREETEKTLERETARNASDLEALGVATAERDSVSTLLESVLLEAQRDPDLGKLSEIEREQRRLNHEIVALREATQAAGQRLSDRAAQWESWLRRGASLPLEGLAEALAVDRDLLASLRSGAHEKSFRALAALAERFNELFRLTGELLEPLRSGQKSAERKLQELAKDLEAIGQQQTPGGFPLFQSLKSPRAGLRTPPEQLCRLVEVKEERWWPALELFLGRNRFAILVDAADYPQALRMLREIPPGREGEALVNPKEARALERPSKPNSLALKVEVADPVARAFVHHLLGDVICVETVEDLDRTDAGRAITPEGIFKQVPTRRRLREDSERRFTLGREGLERMKGERLKERDEVRAQLEALGRQQEDVNGWLDFARRAGLGDPTLPDRSGELARLPELEKQFATGQATAELLRTPEREQRLVQLKDLERRKDELIGRVAVLTTANQSYLIKRNKLAEETRAALEAWETAEHEMTLSRGRMQAGIEAAEVAAFMVPLLAQKGAWRTRIDAAAAKAGEARERARDSRERRNQLRRDLSDARDDRGARRHPQWLDRDSTETDNHAWTARLELLQGHELERHQELAAEKKREWEERVKEQVLDKLNERLNEAVGTVRQLRQYLDRDVGRYRYRVEQKRDPAMSTMWSLLTTGFEPTDDLLRNVKNDEMERAKEELMRAVEAADAPQPDERATRLLDYRTYHRYDVIMEPRTGGAAISLTRSVSKMSGGENQAPFFICMLAAFHRVYDVGNHRNRQNLGLVVMDEAFSKLSGDGIEDCLELARNFQLQLVMAVPIDRLGVMHPYADTTVLCRKFEHRGADGYITRIDNVPTRLTPAQVREAIE